MRSTHTLVFILSILFQYTHCKEYEGERFPSEYLEMDLPTKEDFYTYLDVLKRAIEYFDRNITLDINRSLGIFITKVNLKALLDDHGQNIPKKQLHIIMELIGMIEIQLSLYYDSLRSKEKISEDLQVFGIVEPWLDDRPWVGSVSRWSQGRLAEHLLKPSQTGHYAEEMDTLELSPKDYLDLLYSTDLFFISTTESDECMSHIGSIQPNTLPTMQRCPPDPMCERSITHSPSVAYSLSHRMLNLQMRRMARGCYILSPEADDALLNMLCAEMYRETVYIARKGFIARDMFMEHIGLCSLRSHLEFIRRDWLAQILSWQTSEGCVADTRAFTMTGYYYKMKNLALDEEEADLLPKEVYEYLNEDCHNHPTAVMVTALSAAVRFAAGLFP